MAWSWLFQGLRSSLLSPHNSRRKNRMLFRWYRVSLKTLDKSETKRFADLVLNFIDGLVNLQSYILYWSHRLRILRCYKYPSWCSLWDWYSCLSHGRLADSLSWVQRTVYIKFVTQLDNIFTYFFHCYRYLLRLYIQPSLTIWSFVILPVKAGPEPSPSFVSSAAALLPWAYSAGCSPQIIFFM